MNKQDLLKKIDNEIELVGKEIVKAGKDDKLATFFVGVQDGLRLVKTYLKR